MSDCNFEFNGVALSPKEVVELQLEAISELDMERSVYPKSLINHLITISL